MDPKRFLAPAELRLAVLIFIMTLAGTAWKAVSCTSPEVRAWLDSPWPEDSTAAPEYSRPEPPPIPPEGMDINQATAEELTALPGIGPALAARIVSFREEYGPFSTLEAITQIKGIGPATLGKLKPHLKRP